MGRSGLSPEVIVTEAATLVDASGLDRLTLAAVAARFGVAPPSLYKHVDGLGHLRHLLSVRVAREVGESLRRAATGKSGSDALSAVAHAYRRYARAHPGCYDTLLRAPTPDEADLTAAAQEILSVLLDIIAGYGIDGDEAIDAARYVRSALHGFVSLELVGGFGLPRSLDRSFDQLVSATDRALASW